MNIEEWLDYNDIILLPKVISEIDSRSDIDINIDIFNRKIKFPIIVSPMPDICGSEMAIKIASYGGIGIIHRFQEINQQKNEFIRCLQHGNYAGCSIGINENYMDRLCELFNAGCSIFCIDVANGANAKVGNVIKEIKAKYNNIHIIAGNIASVEGFKYLSDCGADSIRCGIAGGSACSTKTETGIYTPMFSLLKKIREYKDSSNCKSNIIADGGIKSPSCMNKALCFADICMAGGIFAGTKESPGNTIKQQDGSIYKIFRGAASFSTQKYESGKSPLYVEGKEILRPYIGSVEKVVLRYNGGLKSCMSYFNSNNLEDFRKNVSYGIVKKDVFGI